MPPVLIALLIALGVSALGFVVAPWKTLMALGIGLAVLLAAAIAWGTWVYLNRPSRRR